ncbi:MAG: hypothetical protein D6824_01605 [Planctomycetota bacterium]|nr:MAG: hypothetical protein D6824_01605 [Planctomycetota bacterium]
MQFLPLNELLDELRDAGVRSRISEEEGLRFALTGEHAAKVCLGTDEEEARRLDARFVRVGRDEAATLLERLFHKAHVSDVAVAPCASWRPILDAALYELAQDEAWLEIDAEASLHQNGRDPLLLGPDERRLLTVLARGALDAGDAHAGFTAVGLGSPLLIELRCDGSLLVWCESQALADELAGAVEGLTDRKA